MRFVVKSFDAPKLLGSGTSVPEALEKWLNSLLTGRNGASVVSVEHAGSTVMVIAKQWSEVEKQWRGVVPYPRPAATTIDEEPEVPTISYPTGDLHAEGS